MKKTLFTLVALLFSGAILFGQPQMPALPNDPAVKVGKLENGLTYYIRQNDKPAGRAEFYLATHAGAIQETPDQDGLAHFLEHMCFNGTKNFPEKNLLNWLESIGAAFGANINAGTGVEQTTYMLNNIPLLRPSIVDSCLLIMHDYSYFVTCDPVEIDKERGVICEEWRTRRSAAWRMHEKSLPYYYGDSKYGKCTLIGDKHNLETFKPASLVNFYKAWYRPDNQALIVVGDINVDEVEGKIKSIFADVPAPTTPLGKEAYKIPDNKEPIIGIITDPEASNTSVEVFWKSEGRDTRINNTAAGLMTDLLQNIISTIMNERFKDIAAKPDAPFISSYLGIGSFTETMDVVMGNIASKDGEALKALEAFMTEAEKMRRFGFTDDEVERAKTEILSQYENKANKASTRKNADFIHPLLNNFFENYAFMDPSQEYQLVQMIMPNFKTEVINQVCAQAITKENLVVVCKAPEREGLVNPTKEQIAEVITKVENSEIEKPAAAAIPESFLDGSKLKDAKIKSRAEGIQGSTEVVLSNGVKVILLPTDYEKNKINFKIFKKGGRSLISTEELPSFDESIWALYLNNTGIAEFPETIVNKMLAGKQLSVSPFIDAYTHGVSANSTPKDIETALQMTNLYFTAPRFDEQEYNQGIKQIEAVIDNVAKTPDYQFQKAIYQTAFQTDRRVMTSRDVIAKASLKTLGDTYKRLFNGVSGATMIVVGDFKVDEILPLIQKYVGSLKKAGKATDWKYMGDAIAEGSRVGEYKTKMATPKVTVFQCYSSFKPYCVEDVVRMEALSYILDMIYTETLREEEGGTYGASAIDRTTNAPREGKMIQVYFDTNAEQADKLRELAKKGITRVAQEGPTEVEFDKAVKNLQKRIPEKKIRNAFWMSVLENNAKYGFDYLPAYEAAVAALTADQVKAVAAEVVNSGNIVEVILRPEE